MKKIILFLISLSLLTLNSPTSIAISYKLTLSVRQTPSQSESIVTLYGTLKPAKSGTEISIQINTDGSWKSTRFKSKSTKAGTYKVVALATALDAQVKYRASAKINGAVIYSPIRAIIISQLPEISEVSSEALIDQMGPGGRIHGADISRWQHPNDKAIDFVKNVFGRYSLCDDKGI